jgi:predicted PurR-regulated permease PerM
VVVIVFVVDQIMDNFVSPRIMGRSVGVHPAAVLMAALLGYSILGIVGVIVAAPGLASIILMGRYISRKMLDLDPWPENTDKVKEPEYPWTRMIRLARLGYRYLRKWLKRNK